MAGRHALCNKSAGAALVPIKRPPTLIHHKRPFLADYDPPQLITIVSTVVLVLLAMLTLYNIFSDAYRGVDMTNVVPTPMPHHSPSVVVGGYRR